MLIEFEEFKRKYTEEIEQTPIIDDLFYSNMCKCGLMLTDYPDMLNSEINILNNIKVRNDALLNLKHDSSYIRIFCKCILKGKMGEYEITGIK